MIHRVRDEILVAFRDEAAERPAPHVVKADADQPAETFVGIDDLSVTAENDALKCRVRERR